MSLLMLMGDGFTSSAVYATWNPSDKGINVVLSNGNLTAANGESTAWRTTRSTVSKTTGRWYWEIEPDAGTFCIVGVVTASASLNTYAGGDSAGFGYLGFNGQKFTGGSGSAYGSTFAPGDVVGVALNMVDHEVEFFLMAGGVGPGVSQGVIDISSLTGPVFAAVSGYTIGDSATANFGASPFVGTVPNGFNEG